MKFSVACHSCLPQELTIVLHYMEMNVGGHLLRKFYLQMHKFEFHILSICQKIFLSLPHLDKTELT